MPAQTVNYQCPACTGPLHFVGDSGKLECDYCGSTYTVEEIEALYAAKEESAAEAFDGGEPVDGEEIEVDGEPADEQEESLSSVISNEEKKLRTSSKWDDSTISEDWGEAKENMRAYSCPSCGAQMICEATTAATQCPYCGNPSVVPGQFQGALKPDYVIPFKLDRKAAEAALKNHYRKKPFLPRAFTAGNQVKKVQGIYVPFWLFDGEAAAECVFDGTNSRSYRSGDYRITETKHFDVRRSGKVRFERIPTDASQKMPDDLMDSLEPFDYSELKPFSTAYLPGYLADKYDVTIQQSAHRADKRCASTAESVMRADVHGYESVTTKRNNVYIARGKVHYALLPVWILTTKWKDKNYIFAMNGQTGKFVGNLPVSMGKFFGFMIGSSVVLSVLTCLSPLSDLIAWLLTF